MKHAARLAVMLALAVTAPASAGYRLMAAGQMASVGSRGLSVTPPDAWNRLGQRIGRNAESWTLDGLSLNDLTFYAGIDDGRTLFREVDKRERPLPHFSSTMLPTDIPQLFETSYRIAASTALFEIGRVEPASFAGRPGVRFAYSFVQQGEEVRRTGEATGAIIDGRLYLIAFEAPAVHFFARDADKYRAMVATAQVAAQPKKRS